MSAPATLLSVVVPAYDEAACIEASLRRIAAYLEDTDLVAEIVVVDDGSSDSTRERARDAAAAIALPVRVLGYDDNRGKGGALKVGFAAARGDRILFSDADLSTPIETAGALLARLDAGADLAIGSRKRTGAQVEVHQPWWRETMGKVFTLLVRLIVADVSDATCGFKAFRGDAGREIFAAVRIEDWSFDAELLYLAARRGFRVDEVAVVWRDQPGTKVRVVRAALTSLGGLLRIRSNALRGVYGARAEQRLAPTRAPGHVEGWSNAAASAELARVAQ